MPLQPAAVRQACRCRRYRPSRRQGGRPPRRNL